MTAPAIYLAGNPERTATLPEFLRDLLTLGNCERCGCPVAYHGPSRDDMAAMARRLGRVLVTVCRPCGGTLTTEAGGAAIMPVDAEKLARAIRRAKAERQ